MREYYQVGPSDRPKIFGMTASPIWNPKDPEGSLATLEKNLDAIAISVKEHIDELRTNSPRPVEVRLFMKNMSARSLITCVKIIKVYPQPPDDYVYLRVPLRECVYMYSSSEHLGFPWDKIKGRYLATLSSLGPYGADLYLYLDTKERLNKYINAARPPDPFVHEIVKDGVVEDFSTPLPEDVKELQAILAEYKPFFEDESGDVPIPIPLAWCTPKIRLLVDILHESAQRPFQGIVFVEQRQVCGCLGKMLNQVVELQGLIRCGELVGHGGVHSGGSAQARGMGIAKQQDILQSFRDKEINLRTLCWFSTTYVLTDGV